MKRKRIENFVIYINEELGKGSFGKVYKGLNEITKQPVAIKALPKKMIDHDQYVKDALISEIRIMKKLKNESIVGFIDIIQTANNYYVIQELCTGGDLKTAIKKAKHFTEVQAIEYLKQILEGFQELIQNSIVHRDVKPENILINNGRLKLADFGFAKNVVSHNTLQKSMVGTPLYMAPQILKRERYSSKCDVWSVGVVFYEMIYGCLPWTGCSEYELVNNIQKIPLRYSKEIETSQATKDFLAGCLQPNEIKRFGWQQVYQHGIFLNYFKSYTDKNKKLNEKAGYVINNLRLQIHSQNIDLQSLFNKLKYSKNTSLKKPQLYSLLKTIDPQISQEQSQYVFSKFDEDGSGTIEFEEFKNLLKKSDIRMNSIVLGTVQKKNTIIVQEGEPEVLQDSLQEQKIAETLQKLRDTVDKHALSLQAVYQSYDKNKNKSLDFQELRKLLLKIDPTLTATELELFMKKFDINGDKTITFKEFQNTIYKITGQIYSKKHQSSIH